MTKNRSLGSGLIWVLSMLFLMSAITPAFAAAPEGKVVTAIEVAGNRTVSQSTILSAVKTKPGEQITTEAIKKDMQAIYDLGYFYDVAADFVADQGGMKVIFQVVENPVVTEVVMKGNTVMPKAVVDKLFSSIKGHVLNTKTLNQQVRQLEKEYHDRGFILARISDVAMNAQGILTISVNEGTLEGIVIKGHQKTKEYVIRREINLTPGKPFNVKDARRSMQKVYNLGYFEDVNMKLNPGKELNAVVLEVEVKEGKTGNFSIGGGYSSADGLVGFIEVADTNFRGTGDTIKVHWEFGGNAEADSYSLGYTRPWLDEHQTSLGFNVYDITKEQYDYDDNGHLLNQYDERRQGWDVTIGRPFGEYLKTYLTYRQEDVEYSSIDQQDAPDLMDLKGMTKSLTLLTVRDTRDNIFNPTEGSRISLSTEFAGGFLGGDFDFSKYQLDGRRYFPVGKKQVFAVRLMTGFSNGTLPHSEEFEVGGSDTVRGYEEDEFSGNKMLVASAEYRFPLQDKVQAVVFADAGNAWEPGRSINLGDLNTSAGLGLRLTTPIGPIRLDYGWGSEGGRLHFSIGNAF